MLEIDGTNADGHAKRRVTVLGTGRMGSALVQALLARGHAVTVWNRTAAKCAPLAAQGARVAGSVEHAVAEAEIVIANVSDYPTTDALVSPGAVADALGGRLFVQLATGTPQQARAMAGWAGQRQIRYLDGAIMATPDFVGQAACTIVYSGANESFEAGKPVFSAFGNAQHVGADVGHANALDAAILIVLWGSLLGTLQGAALCEAEGFPTDAFASALSATMPVFGSALTATAERIGQRRFAADASTFASVETCEASVRLIHQMNQNHGIHLGLTEALGRIFRQATEAGHAQGDFAALYLAVSPQRAAR